MSTKTLFGDELKGKLLDGIKKLNNSVSSTLGPGGRNVLIQKEDGTTDSRVVLHLPAKLAPIKLAILPLTKKDGLPELAKSLMDECKPSFHCFFEEKDAIGKRYRRQDAIGTPFCVTIDHQTKEDNTVTIRFRDSMQQERIPMSEVKALVLKHIA
mgnify:CR=1 FL=1